MILARKKLSRFGAENGVLGTVFEVDEEEKSILWIPSIV